MRRRGPRGRRRVVQLGPILVPLPYHADERHGRLPRPGPRHRPVPPEPRPREGSRGMPPDTRLLRPGVPSPLRGRERGGGRPRREVRGRPGRVRQGRRPPQGPAHGPPPRVRPRRDAQLGVLVRARAVPPLGRRGRRRADEGARRRRTRLGPDEVPPFPAPDPGGEQGRRVRTVVPVGLAGGSRTIRGGRDGGGGDGAGRRGEGGEGERGAPRGHLRQAVSQALGGGGRFALDVHVRRQGGGGGGREGRRWRRGRRRRGGPRRAQAGVLACPREVRVVRPERVRGLVPDVPPGGHRARSQPRRAGRARRGRAAGTVPP
mmetsp:Transcript_21159/g.47015  ORF Transcript_21159/g.47015 Transcript_21159/m.47015 type:complete len:318 (+) Transcript_21159:414-1367(+)